MKKFIRFAACALAVLCTGTLWAAPAAGWFDFSRGTVNGDTITYSGDNAAYSLVVTGGTFAPDGSYIQLGSPAQAETETTEAVPATTGSISLICPESLKSGKRVTIIADVEYSSAMDNILVEIKLSGTHSIYLKALENSTMQFYWKNGSTLTGYPSGVNPVSWSPTRRQRITFAYSGPDTVADGRGTTLYFGDEPTASARNADGLFSSNTAFSAIKIGDGASGLKIYGLYVYATKLTSASAVASEITAFKAQQTATFATKKNTTISGETNWSDLAWDPSAPTSEEAAVLGISSGANTLTLNNDSAIALTGLVTQGDGTLAIAGSGALSANVTTLNTHLDLTNAPETLALGSVVLGPGKMLTVKNTSFWSALHGSNDSVVRYTAPSGTIAPLGDVIVELAASEPAAGVTLPSSGGNYRVSSGTYAGMTLAITNTQTNYDFAGGDLTFSGEFSFGRATATISGGTIRAEKMVTVQGYNEGRTSSVTQTSGDIILSGNTDGSTTRKAVVMFGHWPNATSTYNLSGGSIKAEQGGMRFGNDSPSTLNLSGTGLLKIKGIWGSGTQTCALNLSGGTLSIGSDGFKSIDRLTVTATGGELNAYASNTIAQSIAVNGPTTFSADAGYETTVTGPLSGSGALTIGTATATGAVNLGTQRPKIAAIADGATLKLTATDVESAGRAIILPTTAESAIAKERFSVVNSTGVAMTVTGTSLADGQLTLTLEASEATLILGDVSDVWSGATAWPNTGSVTINAAQLTVDDKTVKIPAPTEGTRALTQVTVVGNTTAKVTIEVGRNVSIGSLVPNGYVRVDVDTVNALTTAPVVPAGATLEVIAGSTSTDTATLEKAISGAGTFAKGGAGVLTLGANITTSSGSIVQQGTLKIASGGTGIIDAGNYDTAKGDVLVGPGATLDLNGRADLFLRKITLAEGATYQNSGDAVSDGSRQLRDLVLTGNATVTGSSFGLVASGFANATLDLGGYTLTKKGSGNFWLTKCTISNGTLKVKEGTFIGNSKATSCTLSGNVTFERASDATGTARFDFTQATATDSKFLTIASGATLTTAGPAVTDGIKLGYTVLTGNLVANNDVSIAHLQIGANKTLTGTGTITVADTTLNAQTLTTQAHLVLAPSTTTYTASSPKVISAPIVVGSATAAQNKGSLTTRGNLRLSNTSNDFWQQIIVESGVLEATCTGQGIKGGLLIKKDGTFKAYVPESNTDNYVSDKLAYGVAQTIDVYGTLDMNGTRWTLGSGTGSNAKLQTINVYRGATIQGAGQASGNTTYGAFDANISATLNFKCATKPADEKDSNGAIDFSSSLRARAAITLNVESGVTVNFTGNRSRDTSDTNDNSTIAKTGAGKLIVGSNIRLNGECSGPIEVAAEKTLTLSGTVTHTAAFSGAGKILVTNDETSSGTPASSVTLNGTLGTVTGEGATHSSPIEIGSGSELIFNSATPMVLTNAAISGAGSLTIAGSSTFTFGEGSNSTYSGETLVEQEATLVLNCENRVVDAYTQVGVLTAETADTAAVTVNGTLKGLKGAFYRQVKGSGLIQVPSAGALTIGRDNGGASGIVAGFTGTIEVESTGTLSLPSWGGTYEVANCDITNDGRIEGQTDYGTTTVTISNGKTLKGRGEILPSVTFAEGGLLDVSLGAPTLSGVSGTVTVTGNTKAVQPVLKTASEVTFAEIPDYTLPKSGTCYWLVKNTAKVLSAVAPASENAILWSALPWKSSDNMAVSPEIFALGLDLTANVSAAADMTYVALDMAATPCSTIDLTLSGNKLSGNKLLVFYEGTETAAANFKSLTVTGSAVVETALLNHVVGDVTVSGWLYPLDSGESVTPLTKSLMGEGTVAVLQNTDVTIASTLGAATNDEATFTGNLAVASGATLTLTSPIRQKVLGSIICLDTGRLVIGNGSQASGLVFTGRFGTGESSTFGGTLAISANSDFTFASSSAATVTGAVTGTGRLTIGDGSAASTLTLTGALGSVADGVATYAGSLEVAANAELHLKPSVATTLSSAITGAGKVVIGDGTAATQVTQAAVGCDISAIDIAAGATYTVSSGGKESVMLPATTTVKVAEGGKLVISTPRQMNANVTGKGEVEVTSSVKYVFAADQTNRLAPGKLTLKDGLVLHAARDNDTGLSVNELTLENATLSVELAKSVTTTPVVTVATGKVLSGSGSIAAPIVFEDGAIFDAERLPEGNYLKLKDATITWPEESGTVTVKTSKTTQLIQFKSKVGVSHFTLVNTGDDTGLYLYEGAYGSTSMLNVLKKMDSAALPTEIAGNEAVKEAIQAGIEKWTENDIIITEIKAATAQSTAGVAQGSVQALDCFTNLETTVTVAPDWDGGDVSKGIATVTYDFGVSQITVKKAQLTGDTAPQLYVLACAKVSNGKTEEATAAGYADGTKVSLLLDRTEAADAVALDKTTLSNKFGVTAGLGERWFAVPLSTLGTGTHAFTVKAAAN